MDKPYPKSFLTKLYRQLTTIRVFETRCIQLYRQGMIRGYFHPYLDRPIEIVAGLNTPIPFNLALESACVPREVDIVRGVKRALNRG